MFSGLKGGEHNGNSKKGPCKEGSYKGNSKEDCEEEIVIVRRVLEFKGIPKLCKFGKKLTVRF